MGQHFLVNPRIRDKIIRCISPEGEDVILEIGAGRGELTFPLAEKAGRVVAVEADSTLARKLKERSPDNVQIINRDILELDFENLIPADKTKAAGNLPYSISSPILFKILAHSRFFTECHFLLQKEVAERLAAVPGSKAYAPVSAFLQNIYSIQIQFFLSPGNFSPPPKVHSAFVSLIKRKCPLFPEAGSRRFQNFLNRAFQHRRKTLVNNLKAMGVPPDKSIPVLRDAGLPPAIRPEKVSLECFVKLFKILQPFPDL